MTSLPHPLLHLGINSGVACISKAANNEDQDGKPNGIMAKGERLCALAHREARIEVHYIGAARLCCCGASRGSTLDSHSHFAAAEAKLSSPLPQTRPDSRNKEEGQKTENGKPIQLPERIAFPHAKSWMSSFLSFPSQREKVDEEER